MTKTRVYLSSVDQDQKTDDPQPYSWPMFGVERSTSNSPFFAQRYGSTGDQWVFCTLYDPELSFGQTIGSGSYLYYRGPGNPQLEAELYIEAVKHPHNPSDPTGEQRCRGDVYGYAQDGEHDGEWANFWFWAETRGRVSGQDQNECSSSGLSLYAERAIDDWDDAIIEWSGNGNGAGMWLMGTMDGTDWIYTTHASWFDREFPGPPRFGIFHSSADETFGAVQQGPIANATDLASGVTACNQFLAALRDYGWLAP